MIGNNVVLKWGRKIYNNYEAEVVKRNVSRTDVCKVIVGIMLL